MSSEEDVLFQVNHVKYKKDEGTLYIMSKRLAWIQDNKEVVTLSHLYSDIKSQKISPEGKPKIQLQIILYDGTTFTFQFINPNGPQTQIKIRNQVKEYLLELLQKFKRKINPELEEKNKLLIENPQLMQLYRDLVMTEIVNSEEFWKDHAPKFISTSTTTKANAPGSEAQQDVGVSSGFLSGIQPVADGVNGVIYNLTNDIMESIFRTYPAVRRKHDELVPSQMNESEFWTKFFQSHYFHRDRVILSKDIFYSCARSDDKEMKKEIEHLRQEHKDLISLIDETEGEELNHYKNILKIDEGRDPPAVAAHKNMIKRFNQHSIMLLKASESLNKSSGSETNAVANGSANAPATDPTEPPPKKKRKKDKTQPEEIIEPEMEKIDPALLEANAAKLQSRIILEDLKDIPEASYQKLKLTKIERYLNGPVPVFQTRKIPYHSIKETTMKLKDISKGWTAKPVLLTAKDAAAMIADLSPGGSIMKTHVPDSASQIVPPEVENEFRNIYISLSELLRVFWSCFPATTQSAADKLKRSYETIKKFEGIKLQQLKDRLLRDHLPLALTSHLSSTIAAADLKYNRWITGLNKQQQRR